MNDYVEYTDDEGVNILEVLQDEISSLTIDIKKQRENLDNVNSF
jgi:hypothetical protein